MEVSIPRLPVYYGTFQSLFLQKYWSPPTNFGNGCVLSFHPDGSVCILRLSCVCRFVNDWPRPHRSLWLAECEQGVNSVVWVLRLMIAHHDCFLLFAGYRNSLDICEVSDSGQLELPILLKTPGFPSNYSANKTCEVITSPSNASGHS